MMVGREKRGRNSGMFFPEAYDDTVRPVGLGTSDERPLRETRDSKLSWSRYDFVADLD